MKYLGMPSSGSMAGTVFSHNRAGQYTRNRRAPVQPIGTGRRAFIRATFGAMAGLFASLSTTEQDSWTTFAAGHPVTDSLGQSITLTGQQMFVRCNVSLVNCGGAWVTTPPTDFSPPNITPAAVSCSIAGGITPVWNPGAPSQFVCQAYSMFVSSAVRFIKTFWQPPGVDGVTAADAGTYSMTMMTYAAQFGTPTIGSRIFCRLTPCCATGYNGAPVIISALVTA